MHTYVKYGKSILNCLAAASFFFATGCQTIPTQPPHPERAQILALPVGIEVIHLPNPVKAIRGGPSKHKYTWVFTTSVKAIDRDLKITEFGVFRLRDGIWRFSNYTGRKFTAHDFAKWYSCFRAKLIRGRVYSDHENWSGNDMIEPSKSWWYFIGVDNEGKKWRGDAVVSMSPDLK